MKNPKILALVLALMLMALLMSLFTYGITVLVTSFFVPEGARMVAGIISAVVVFIASYGRLLVWGSDVISECDDVY